MLGRTDRRLRLVVVLVLFAALAVGMVVRLSYWQLSQASVLRQQAVAQLSARADPYPERRDTLGNLIDSENGLHSANQVHEQVTRNPGSVFLPATPTRKGEAGRKVFRGGSEPRIPIQIFGRQIRRRRIFPCAGGIIPSQGRFHQAQCADRTLVVELSLWRIRLNSSAARPP